MDSAPTRSPYRPMFLAKDCASMSSWGLPSGAVALANMRSDAASAFRSPLAKPCTRVSMGSAGTFAGRSTNLTDMQRSLEVAFGLPWQSIACMCM
eukprot:scaffold76887_cov21-Tisochrysis_lutea.AAC.2